MSYLPAPYESAQQDDLPAALAAGLAATLAGITSWVLGSWAYQGIRSLMDDVSANRSPPSSLLVPTVGWSISVVLMVVGALLLIFRRGRGALILGALVSIATTAVAQYELALGPATQSQWWLYWGGIGVLVVASLPATGRWVRKAVAAPVGFPTTAAYRPH